MSRQQQPTRKFQPSKEALEVYNALGGKLLAEYQSVYDVDALIRFMEPIAMRMVGENAGELDPDRFEQAVRSAIERDLSSRQTQTTKIPVPSRRRPRRTQMQKQELQLPPSVQKEGEVDLPGLEPSRTKVVPPAQTTASGTKVCSLSSSTCPSDSGYGSCLKTMCEKLAVSGTAVCDDPFVNKMMNSALFQPLGLSPGSSFEALSNAMNARCPTDQIELIEDFAAKLYAYLDNKQSPPGPDLAIGLQQFIQGLVDRVDAARKHACAGDKCAEPEDPSTFLSFDEIAGAEREKEEINKAFVYPAMYPGLFPTAAKGILFYGPPGTGKTVLANATARMMQGAAYYAPTPADFKGGVVGETEKKIKNVFECACERVATDPKYDQAIIFIDEFEAIGGQRGGAGAGVSSSALTVPTLLQLLEGASAERYAKIGRISVLAATNLPWCLDGAILRRFPVQVFVDLPDANAREFMIRDKLNRAFSHFLSWDEYANLPAEEKEKATWKTKPYTLMVPEDPTAQVVPGGKRRMKANVMIKANELETSGGIYKEMLHVCMFHSMSFDDFIQKLVAMTGPQDTPKAREVRKGLTDDYEFSPWGLDKSPYGFSGSDVKKAMDAIISAVGESVLPVEGQESWTVMRWDEFKATWINAYKEAKKVIEKPGAVYGVTRETVDRFSAEEQQKVKDILDSVPVYVQENHLFAVSPKIKKAYGAIYGEPFDSKDLDDVKRKKIITWELDPDIAVGEFNSAGERITTGIIDDMGSIKLKEYEDIVEYSITKQKPERASC